MNLMKNKKEFVVLVVEDSIEISNLITLYLEENYAVLHASTGREAISVFEEKSVDLIILDLMLPHMNGYEVMREIRKKRNTPIIIVSAKNTDEEKIIGLQKGADDYITKPFNPLELNARVEANIRRFYKFGSVEVTEEVIHIKDLILDCRECCLYKGKQKIVLTNIEYKLLKLLMSSPGKVFTQKEIFERIWEEEYYYENNSIMVYISKIRDYIEIDSKKPQYIITVRGLGYKFEK